MRIDLLAEVHVWVKTFEKIIKLQLQENVAKVQPLSPCQHGFCVFVPCTVSNLLLCDAVIAAFINQNEASDIISFDFKRAFEKVPHSLLLDSLRTLHLHNLSLQWIGIASRLVDRNVLSLMAIRLMLRQSIQESFKVLYLGLNSLLHTLTLCYGNYLYACHAQVRRLAKT